MVVVALVLGAFGQTGQVSRHNALFKEQVEEKHENATRMLIDHQQESQMVGKRDQRLQKFLRERDIGAPVGLGDTRDVGEDRKLLPVPVLCMSEMQQKGSGRRRKRDDDEG